MKERTLLLLKESMKHKEVVELVQEASDRIWHSLPDVTSFEHTCFTNIGRELLKGEVKSVRAMAIHYIRRAEARHLKITKYERPDFFSEVGTTGKEEGEEVLDFEHEDVLADVEKEVMVKEMTALLAQDDHRKKMILGSWSDGNDNNSTISNLLAQTLGGKSESHRKYIQRFRKDCREILSTAI